VDVAAPGEGILSTVSSAGYAHYSGTSMATPYMAAVAALMRAYRRALGPDQVEQAIEASAVDLGVPGHDADHGVRPGRAFGPAADAAESRRPPTARWSSGQRPASRRVVGIGS
jgi:subtilisin family serine protease